MEKEFLKSIIKDARDKAFKKANEVVENAWTEYSNYRGDNYLNEISSLISGINPRTNETINIDKYFSELPFFLNDIDFTSTFMNKSWEERSPEDAQSIKKYNDTHQGINVQQLATLVRYNGVANALNGTRSSDAPFSEEYRLFIEDLRDDIDFNQENPYEESDKRIYILKEVLENEDNHFYMYMKEKNGNSLDFNQISLDIIKADPRLNGKKLDISKEDLDSNDLDYVATRIMIRYIRPEEFTEDMMNDLYSHHYSGAFNNPEIAQKYNTYVKEQQNLKNIKKSEEEKKTETGDEDLKQQTNIEKYKSAIIEKQKIIDALRENIARLLNELGGSKRENVKLKEENEALTKDNRILRTDLDNISDFFEKLKKSILGKLFFKKVIRALPESRISQTSQYTQRHYNNSFREEIKADPEKQNSERTSRDNRRRDLGQR